MELTYYDTREQPQEKKKPRERSSQPTESVSGSDISLPASRSLGPREIKRRPLPQSPGGSVLAQSSPAPVEQAAPQRPPKVPHDDLQHYQQQPIHAPLPTRPRGGSESPLPPQPPQELYYDEPEQYGQMPTDDDQHEYHHRHQRAHSMPVEQQQPWQYPLGRQHRDYQPEAQHHYDNTPDRPREDPLDYPPPHPSSASAYPSEDEIWQHQQRPQSVHMHSDPVTPQYSSPAHRPLPTSANSDSQLVQYHPQRRLDLTPTRSAAYADSPLRHSMSQQDVYSQPAQSDAPPPLPPKHRDTPSRRPRNEYPPSAYIPQPLRIGQKRSSVNDRSPLQSLEDGCDSQWQDNTTEPQTPQSQPQPQRRSMYIQASQQYESPQQQIELHGRRSTHEMQPHISDSDLPQQRPMQRSRQNSYEIRHASFDPRTVQGSQPFAAQDNYHSGYDDALQPTVEDAPPSPGLQPAVARKAVGASPKKLNTVPFGPDSYDVLNPGSSPVTNERAGLETPEQAKESQRLKEVGKLRDLGPIIGNDGREIDPSDHLPADTWAPEPERKNRKPEHVIHIRSKGDANRPQGARASPIVIRHGSSTSALSSPAPATPQPASSPAARTTPNSFFGGRNRLQKAKPAAARPLPNQPYGSPAGAAISSPALAGSPQQIPHDEQQYPARPPQNRRPSSDNRVSSQLSRPPLSEYQVPVGNSYTPRSSSHDNYGSQQKSLEYTPTKQPPQTYNAYSSPAGQHDRRESYDRRNSYDNRERRNSYDQRSDYSYENHVSYDPAPQQPQQQKYYDDPLAAEMSLIDIGPSRNSYHQGSMGRSMVRRW